MDLFNVKNEINKRNQMNSSKFYTSRGKESFLEDSGNVRYSSARLNDNTTRQHSQPTVRCSETSSEWRGRRDGREEVGEYERLVDSRQSDALLGYDWIASMLDNIRSQSNGVHGDDEERLIEGVREFRQHNKHDCIGSSRILNDLDLGQTELAEIRDPGHTCIHGYIMNARLFTEPVNVDMNGTSVCPVCLTPRPPPTTECPGFVRVSIPKNMIQSPYKIKPHRRNSIESLDSFALSQHCQAGYKVSKPVTVRTAKNVDLKDALNGINSPLTTLQSEEEARQIINQTMKRIPGSVTREIYLPTASLAGLGLSTRDLQPIKNTMKLY